MLKTGILAGRTTAGNAGTFTAITELQYDRLVAWAEGDFETETPQQIFDSLDVVPLQFQPSVLIQAQLEATIGAPLYPGIEMSWNAEKVESYDLDHPFSINASTKAGDLTRYLSLPWQSDFYMCRNYW
jgi:hypothetical protein